MSSIATRAVTDLDAAALAELVERDVRNLISDDLSELEAALVRLAAGATYLRIVNTMSLALTCE